MIRPAAGNQGTPADVTVAVGEGIIGKCAALGIEAALTGRTEIAESFKKLNDTARNILIDRIGRERPPGFQGVYPIVTGGRTDYVLTVFLHDTQENLNQERHRLLALLHNLLSLRLEIVSIAGQLRESSITATDRAVAGLDESLIVPPVTEPSKAPVDLVEIIRRAFTRHTIYGNLYKIGERALAVNLKLDNMPAFDVAQNELDGFFNTACRLFSEHTETDEMLTISTYTRGEYAYIDISRHKENFPAVEPVAGFGTYVEAEDLEPPYRTGALTEYLSRLSADFAYDRRSRRPSYFSFRLRPKIAVESGITRPAEKQLTILAVDDQTVILDLLAAMCQSLGYKIYTAREGLEGLALFDRYRPDMVITDLAMPKMSGWELAEKIKTVSPRTPIVIITGWGVTVEESRMRRIGIEHVLHKPFRLEQLAELISHIKYSRIPG
jgi:CheY-like chemotaxis protein